MLGTATLRLSPLLIQLVLNERHRDQWSAPAEVVAHVHNKKTEKHALTLIGTLCKAAVPSSIAVDPAAAACATSSLAAVLLLPAAASATPAGSLVSTAAMQHGKHGKHSKACR